MKLLLLVCSLSILQFSCVNECSNKTKYPTAQSQKQCENQEVKEMQERPMKGF